MGKIYFYGDSFTEPGFSAYRIMEQTGCSRSEANALERKLHYTTLVSERYSNLVPVIDAMGGWSNQDILVRILRDLPNYTREDIVVAIGTEGSRLLMPSKLKHSIQQHGNPDGVSVRAKGLSLVGVPSTILANEYERDTSSEHADNWKAGVDMYYHNTLPYEYDYRIYWSNALASLFNHIKEITNKSFYHDNTIWPQFENWGDVLDVNDGHWSINGWKAVSKFIIDEMETVSTGQRSLI